MGMMKRLWENNMTIVYDVIFKPNLDRKWFNPFAAVHGATIILRNELAKKGTKASVCLLRILNVFWFPFDLCFIPGAYRLYRKGKAIGYYGSFDDWRCDVMDVGDYVIEENRN